VAAFLTEEWLDELARALEAAEPLAQGPRFGLGQLVTGAPGGDVAYTLLVGGGEPGELRRGLEAATVVLVEDYDTAAALVAGDPVADLLAAGRIKVRGDAAALVDAAELVAALGELLSLARGARRPPPAPR
jgi:hypothetical protein